MRRIPYAYALSLLAACAADAEFAGDARPGCRVHQPSTPLAAELGELSGLAVSRRFPGVLWAHNDSGGDPVIYAVRPTGQLVGRVPIQGARHQDWEDLALGPCGDSECLYIADIGDNNARRAEVVVYRVPEPDPRAARPVTAERLRFRYPDGPRDAEALFVLPTGELYVVTKGREARVTVYRHAGPRGGEGVMELERVAELSTHAPERRQQVTGADASPSGRWVGVRSYGALHLFPTDRLRAGETRPALRVDLTPVGEAQGEAIALQDDGTVWLGSEGGFREAPGTVAALRCELPAQ